ncbi:MAG: sugar ABC transporter permease [Devosia sp.]|uniref:carbohydrate ABC transporter permease n=1 Tax=Devosia sp. TaxID=1871048 RepID=UPI001A44A9BE|nr:sugar ABC transporter permease [Devosia sp.]MBL8600185.1 sugar ABC transporter permease [Devosia sp.]
MQLRSHTTAGFWFVLPAMLVVVALLLYPVLSSIFFSFTNRNLLKTVYAFVGAQNFLSVLNSRDFWNAFFTSIKWTAGSVLGQLVVGLLAALALERVPRFSGLYRTLLVIPWAFPAIVIAFSWRWILNDVYGFLPNLLSAFRITNGNVSFLADPQLVFAVALAINIWFGAPLFMINILAALKTVPRDQYEAAMIDGANLGQRFWYITVPHVRRVIGLLLILRTIWVFNNFELLFLITGGGPAGLTTTLPIHAYRTGWGLRQLGMASAITVLLLIFLLVAAALAFKLVSRWERTPAR